MPNQFTSLLPTEERFWSHVDKTEGCWRWTAAHGTTGYGLFKVGGRMVRAHRFIYERNVGPIPNNRILDHICRTRDCVRFSHLRLATVRDNTLWGESFAAVNAKKTHCPAGHPYDEANTGLITRSTDGDAAMSEPKWVVVGEEKDEGKRGQYWYLSRDGQPYGADGMKQLFDPFGTFTSRIWCQQTCDYLNALEERLARAEQERDSVLAKPEVREDQADWRQPPSASTSEIEAENQQWWDNWHQHVANFNAMSAQAAQSRAAVNALREARDFLRHLKGGLSLYAESGMSARGVESLGLALGNLDALLSPEAQTETPPEYGLAQSIYAQENEEDD